MISPVSHVWGANESISVYSIPKWDHITLYRPGDYAQHEGVYYVSRFPNIDHPPNLNLAHLWSILPIPEVESVVASQPTIIPLRLFDISLTLVDTLLSDSSELVAQTEFTSFGTAATLVTLEYAVEDSSNNIVYSVGDKIIIETEEIVTKNFNELGLAPGKYTLFLKTTYGENIQDEFRQSFEVKKTPNYLVVFIVILSVIGGYVIYAINKGQVLNLPADTR